MGEEYEDVLARVVEDQRRMFPWVVALTACYLLAVAAFVLGATTGTRWATFTALGLIWVGAAIAILLCLRTDRKGR